MTLTERVVAPTTLSPYSPGLLYSK